MSKKPERTPTCEMTDHLWVKSEMPPYGSAFGAPKWWTDGYTTLVCVICQYAASWKEHVDE